MLLNRICGIASLAVVLLGGVVHASTFIAYCPGLWRLISPLLMASFVLGVLVIASFMEEPQDLPPGDGNARGIFGKWRASKKRRKAIERRTLSLIPVPLRIACAAAFLYTVVNPFVCLVLMEGGSPDIDNGRYYLVSHAVKVREVPEDEYRRLRAYEARAMSGHFIFFGLAPAVYFLRVRSRLWESLARDALADSPQAGSDS